MQYSSMLVVGMAGRVVGRAGVVGRPEVVGKAEGS